ncbi:glycosyl hydrolase family 65 protein [Sphingobacterium populi]|nr:glycosyl hydrolase family 65 protein [Sphingobacterium sp. CFCC 11742]
MRVRDGKVHFQPILPSQWTSYCFRITFRGADLQVTINRAGVQITNSGQHSADVVIAHTVHRIASSGKLDLAYSLENSA